MLNHYSPEEKLTAVALTKLNIQKQALEQLKQHSNLSQKKINKSLV